MDYMHICAACGIVFAKLFFLRPHLDLSILLRTDDPFLLLPSSSIVIALLRHMFLFSSHYMSAGLATLYFIMWIFYCEHFGPDWGVKSLVMMAYRVTCRFRISLYVFIHCVYDFIVIDAYRLNLRATSVL